MDKVLTWIRRLQQFADRPWYFPVLGLLAGLDLFILLIPTDALLVSSVMLKPKKWIGAGVWVSLGSALGAVLLASLIQWNPILVFEQWFPHAFETAAWRSMDWFFDEYGGRALFFIALSPLVQFPAVAIAALSGMSLTKLFFVYLLGRLIKSLLFSYGGSHGSKLLFRLPMLRKDLQVLETPTDPAA